MWDGEPRRSDDGQCNADTRYATWAPSALSAPRSVCAEFCESLRGSCGGSLNRSDHAGEGAPQGQRNALIQ